jgi:hypothetical protein
MPAPLLFAAESRTLLMFVPAGLAWVLCYFIVYARYPVLLKALHHHERDPVCAGCTTNFGGASGS